jgi:outer membrane protein OmpA-like peptidoglycan-associated protein
MNIMQSCAAAAVAVAIALPGAALAQSSRLHLIVGGEAYDGPPSFEVTFDGEVLGEATVDAAIDTVKAGRFADAADKTPYVQSFEFEIPEYVFDPEGEVRIRLVNEAFGGEGSDRDRNLYLAAVAINGGAVTVSGLVTATSEGFKPNQMLGEFLVLEDGNEQGVSPAPRGGWPDPGARAATVANARLLPDPSQEPGMMPVPGLTAIRAPETGVSAEAEVGSAAGATDVAAITSVAVDAGATDAPVTTAGIEPACKLDQIYNVIGFNENSNDLTPRLIERLDQIIGDIGGEASCRVLVTGYSDTQGTHATNALFAVERAQNVLTYLKQNGLKYYKATAAGGGATTQFGDTPSANRRVVIAVLP